MQAFVAGVEYEDRPLQTEAAKRDREAAEQMKSEIERINQELAKFEPIARPNPQLTTQQPTLPLKTTRAATQRAGQGPTPSRTLSRTTLNSLPVRPSSFASRFTIAIFIRRSV